MLLTILWPLSLWRGHNPLQAAGLPSVGFPRYSLVSASEKDKQQGGPYVNRLCWNWNPDRRIHTCNNCANHCTTEALVQKVLPYSPPFNFCFGEEEKSERDTMPHSTKAALATIGLRKALAPASGVCVIGSVPSQKYGCYGMDAALFILSSLK